MTCCPGAWGDWVAAGTSDGQVAVLDRRNGRLVWLWRAHSGAVIRLFVTDRNRLLTMGADRCAIVWDLARSSITPLRVSTLRGLPDRGGMPPNAAAAARLNPGGAGETVLFAISRHKILASLVPQDGADVTAQPCSFVDPSLRKIRRFDGLAVQAVALLPLRRLLVLGCDDGWLRVCT
ncbi:unnamed protein product [Phaeothamnion confervicola]